MKFHKNSFMRVGDMLWTKIGCRPVRQGGKYNTTRFSNGRIKTLNFFFLFQEYDDSLL
jgi:hypothetical protein